MSLQHQQQPADSYCTSSGPANYNEAEAEAEPLRARAHSTGTGSGPKSDTLRVLANRARHERTARESLSNERLVITAAATTTTVAPTTSQTGASRGEEHFSSGSGLGGGTSTCPIGLQQQQQQQTVLAACGGEQQFDSRRKMTMAPSERNGEMHAAHAGTSYEVGGKTSESGGANINNNIDVVDLDTRNNNNNNNYQPDRTYEKERQALGLLRKNSFTCTVLGARQTGKRTIVKCFVKLLNEFKLAADEYKKEKMLSKLVECSERIQELERQQQEQQQQADEMERGHRSRLNSWLGGGAVNRLLNLSPVNKQRLHSVASLWHSRESPHSLSANDPAGGPQRRHTAIEPSIRTSSASRAINLCSSPTASAGGGGGGTGYGTSQTGGNRRFLGVERINLTACGNSSDSNVYYTTIQASVNSPPTPTTSGGQCNQLRVPDLDTNNLRKNSDPGALRRTSQSPGSVFLANDSDEIYDYREVQQQQQQPHSYQHHSQQQQQPVPSNIRIRRRNQSIALNHKGRIVLLSLKELNRRRCGIKFKTRKRISERYLEILKSNNRETLPKECDSRQAYHETYLPDSFIVVYSINDRESFEYSRSLIGQIRAYKPDIPLPIVLVANKIDLERARVVKNEEGRLLARKNACKFMEISCTVGFNLDNLLVGLRTQLILRHHIMLNSVLKGKSAKSLSDTSKSTATEASEQTGNDKGKVADNILVRFYRRYVMDNYKQNYDCDNFSKL